MKKNSNVPAERPSYHGSSAAAASSQPLSTQDRKCDSCGYRVAINEC